MNMSSMRLANAKIWQHNVCNMAVIHLRHCVGQHNVATWLSHIADIKLTYIANKTRQHQDMATHWCNMAIIYIADIVLTYVAKYVTAQCLQHGCYILQILRIISSISAILATYIQRDSPTPRYFNTMSQHTCHTRQTLYWHMSSTRLANKTSLCELALSRLLILVPFFLFILNMTAMLQTLCWHILTSLCKLALERPRIRVAPFLLDVYFLTWQLSCKHCLDMHWRVSIIQPMVTLQYSATRILCSVTMGSLWAVFNALSRHNSVCCSVLQCAAVCCSVLQCVAEYCCTLL